MTEKRQRSNSSEVVNKYLLGGVVAVQKLADERGGISRKVLRTAMHELSSAGKDHAALEAWCRETWGFGLSNRGRPGPALGEERTYAVLHQKDAGPDSTYVRVPLTPYQAEKASRVRIRFEEGGPRFLGLTARA